MSVTVTHNGEGSFVIRVYAVTDRDVLVDLIAPFEGIVPGVDITMTYVITADGDWSIDVS